MSKKILSAGVAGAGAFGGYHAAKYASIEGVRLAGVYDIDAAAATRLAALHGAQAFTDYTDFLTCMDVVTIASPAATHYALTQSALKAGKHVYVEKPISLRLEEADALIKLAERVGLILQTGHQERVVFDALGLTRKAKPRAVICRRMNEPAPRGTDISATLDLMIHDLDLVRRMGFAQPIAVQADGDHDEVSCAFAFADGARAEFKASRRAAQSERKMTLTYDDGRVDIDFIRRTVIASDAGLKAQPFGDGEALKDPLGFSVRRFVEAVTNAGAPVADGKDGRDALEWALMIEDAAAAKGSGVKERA